VQRSNSRSELQRVTGCWCRMRWRPTGLQTIRRKALIYGLRPWGSSHVLRIISGEIRPGGGNAFEKPNGTAPVMHHQRLFVQFEALNPRVDVSDIALAPKKTAAVYCTVKAGL